MELGTLSTSLTLSKQDLINVTKIKYRTVQIKVEVYDSVFKIDHQIGKDLKLYAVVAKFRFEMTDVILISLV